MKYQKICIMGLGYIGLPTASTFATHGVSVVGVDINPQVLATLRSGGLHIHEPGLRTLVQAALGSGNLVVSEVPQPADAFIIAVPTPFYDDKRADMRAVTSATQAIVPYLTKGNLVVLESTSPPRTTVDMVAPILEQSGLKAGRDFYLAYTPERVLPGQIIRELVENARVIGGVDAASAEAARDLYKIFARGEIYLTDATTAEMVKLMENTSRDINIAIANTFSRLADRFGINAWEAIALANKHPRVKILRPGPGVGGHCISVDPWFLVEAAPDLTSLILTSRQVNDSQPHFVVELVRRALKGLPDTYQEQPLLGRRIAALGLSYKPDVDDLRESPAIEVVHLLQAAGAQVKAYEPFKPDAQFAHIHTVPTLEEALVDAEAILFLAAHQVFKEFTPAYLQRITPARILIDTVGILDAETWRPAGFNTHLLGDRKSDTGK